MIGFSIVDPTSDIIEGEPAPLARPEGRPIVVGRSAPNDGHASTADDKIRLAARTAVRAYTGKDAFVKRIKRSHATERNWLPNLRTAQALLSIIDGLQANRDYRHYNREKVQ